MPNWLLVSSPQNFAASRDRGFDVAGMKSRHRRKWERVRPGDRVFFYLTGAKAIGGMARVAGDPYEDHRPIWQSKGKPDEDYPWRFPIEPLNVLEAGHELPAEPLAREMEHTKRWPAESWTLAFQGNVHELSDADADLLELALRAAAGAEQRASNARH
jgi:hypothetical protein